MTPRIYSQRLEKIDMVQVERDSKTLINIVYDKFLGLYKFHTVVFC